MKFFLPLFLVICICSTDMYAQGCSDAGFCTMGAMRPNQSYSKKLNLTLRSIEVSQYFGMTTFYLKILAYNADINIGITPRLTAQIKLPYQFVYGHLANTNGFGDISLSATYSLVSNESFQINLSAGAKIPTGDANKTTHIATRTGVYADRALPMYYQTTLGTYDFIAGASLSSKNWLFATGIQIDLTPNKNQFVWGAWNKTADSAAAQQYPKSRNLQRGIDIMGRVERNFRFSNWNAYIGLLAIYRITKDKFQDAPDGVTREVRTENHIYGSDIGTDNFAVSLLVGGGYRFTTKSAIKLMFGYRLIDRTAFQLFKGKEFEMERNPDGLSRLMVTTLGYEYRF